MMHHSSPSPPFAELGFYFRDRADHESLRMVAEALIRAGAQLTGRAYVHTGADASRPFGGPTDFEVETIDVSDLDDLFSRPESSRVTKLDVKGLYATRPDDVAIVTFARVLEPAVSGHPVEVWLSGDQINLAWRDGRSHREASALRALFDALVADLDPSYAAMMMEQDLKTPGGLIDPKSRYDFDDFYLSEAFVGPSGIAAVRQALEPVAQLFGRGVIVISNWIYGGPRNWDRKLAAVEFRDRVLAAAARTERSEPD